MPATQQPEEELRVAATECKTPEELAYVQVAATLLVSKRLGEIAGELRELRTSGISRLVEQVDQIDSTLSRG